MSLAHDIRAERLDADEVPLGRLFAHRVTFAEAVLLIADRAEARLGGYVVTPNVDHVCVAERDDRLVGAYGGAWLSAVDGKPLLWLAQLQGTPLPEKISGSDLAEPVLREAAARGLRVYLFGHRDHVAQKAKEALEQRIKGIKIVGVDSPRYDPDAPEAHIEPALERVRAARPHLVIVALGSPKQELFMHRFAPRLDGALLLGFGGVMAFFAGEVRRAPGFVSAVGMEWAWRLAMEPRRLWRRYLVRDRAFLPLLFRTWLRSRQRRRRGGRDGQPPACPTAGCSTPRPLHPAPAVPEANH